MSSAKKELGRIINLISFCKKQNGNNDSDLAILYAIQSHIKNRLKELK